MLLYHLSFDLKLTIVRIYTWQSFIEVHLSPPVAWAAVRSKAVVLLLLTGCLLLLQLWESVIVLCFAVRYFMYIVVLQSSWWRRESWLLCLVCLPGVSWLLCGSSLWCHGFVCSFWLWYFLIILTYYFWPQTKNAAKIQLLKMIAKYEKICQFSNLN